MVAGEKVNMIKYMHAWMYWLDWQWLFKCWRWKLEVPWQISLLLISGVQYSRDWRQRARFVCDRLTNFERVRHNPNIPLETKIGTFYKKWKGLVATKSAESGSLIIKEKALLVLARDQVGLLQNQSVFVRSPFLF